MTERVRVAPLSEQEIGAIAYRGCSVAHEYFNRLLSIARDHAQLVAERDALRAELARIRAHIESSHNEVTCSQDARHANDGDDRVPMLTCMTCEAHTLRAENAKLLERVEKLKACRTLLSQCRVGWIHHVLRDEVLAALAATEEEPTP